MRPGDWVAIADAIVELAPGHTGIVVLHGTDTLAFTASALSFMLAGVDRPIVVTGAQRPITEHRSDAPQNLTTACMIASPRTHELPIVPEVSVWFYDVLLRGNRTSKVDADSYTGFASRNLSPLGTAGVALRIDRAALQAPAAAGCVAWRASAPMWRPCGCTLRWMPATWRRSSRAPACAAR